MFLLGCDKDWNASKKCGGQLKGLALNFTNNSGELYLLLCISFMFPALTVYHSKAWKPYHNFTGT